VPRKHQCDISSQRIEDVLEKEKMECVKIKEVAGEWAGADLFR